MGKMDNSLFGLYQYEKFEVIMEFSGMRAPFPFSFHPENLPTHGPPQALLQSLLLHTSSSISLSVTRE